jgi:hypothetical protein
VSPYGESNFPLWTSCTRKENPSNPKCCQTFIAEWLELHISRASNKEADNLANIRSQCLPIPPGVFWEEIVERSIKGSKTSSPGEVSQHVTIGSGASKIGTESTAELEEVMMIEKTWMQPYLVYMMDKILPEDTIEAHRII